MPLTRSKVFLIFCLSFIFGVLFAPIISNVTMAIMAIVFVMCISIGWSNKYSKLIGFAGLILLCGVVRFQTSTQHNNLRPFYNQKAQVVGVITAEPDIREDKIYLTLSDLKINNQSVNDKILVSIYTSRNYSYGDRIQFTGKILEPKEFQDFNYKNYLSRFGINAVVYYPTAEIIAGNQGNLIKSKLLEVKHRFLTNLTQVLPEPQNGFLAGILVGNKRSLPQYLVDAFNTTGTSHIIAVSGFNITIIVWALDWCLQRFGRKISFLVNLIVIGSFVILTGGSASVVRASIMGILVLVAKNIGRLYQASNALVIAAAVMIFINPKILLFDVGFQLSFLALAGLIFLSPILAMYTRVLPVIIRESLVATIAAQVFALPILLYNFDTLSLVSPLSNILVLPFVPITMLFGFLTGLTGFVWYALAAALAWPAWILLSYIIQIIIWTASIPFASLHVHINLGGLVIYYILLIAGLAYRHFYIQRKLLESQKQPYIASSHTGS